ncbi:L,D-transpeptidase family protein [Swaminathania salitolerans]|uniref:L,D-TPase catalytic domain-containing protein n=1 Tax=Swaminathania salitolerans TaxID=182838 RepID=A0A511BQE6_9PROT|nr:L,D-transpeptidase family protein [Swaminathania salitolerans]GBQ15315.1 hypothetical protein AA21291_2129 [Swaminathania salitolerans LMG 21291]GEL02063.1 hypothetical protein SSA02_12260 [Swaminathania salitolerans]
MNVILRPVGVHEAVILLDGAQIPVAIGAGGISAHKNEGDHATPVGVLPFRRVFYRADRTSRPETTLPVEALSPHDGWCDDAGHPDYNRFVTTPHPASHERLWRDDNSYDLIVVLGWNDLSPVPGRGSAIFMHLPTRSGFTEGCIALPDASLRQLLRRGVSGIEVQGH